jgi:WD40 repeat protein
MFSPNGHVLASGNGDGTTTLWNVDTQVSTATLGRAAASSASSAGQTIDGVTFSSDGATLATANGDGTVALWDMATSKKITTIPGSTSARSSGLASSVAFSPSGSILAISHDAATVTLWNVATRTVVATLPGTVGQWVYSLAFSPDGQLLATGSGNTPGSTTGTPGMVQVWQVATRKVLATVAHTNTGPGALAFSGQKLANVNADGTVSVRNLVTQGKAAVLTNVSSNAKSVAFRSDGKEIMTGNGDGTATLFDTTTRKITRTLDTGTKAEVPSVAYRHGAPGLACAGENLVLWT